MRVAVLSDIHANVHALEAVLAAADADNVDAVWCLGDLVGYGPQPNRCVALVAERAALCLAGNHDLAAIEKLPLAMFNGDAGTAVRWTSGVLDPAARAFLSGLAPTASIDGVELFHGSPLDPIWDYVLSEHAAEASFRATTAPLVLVGHSHAQLALSWNGRRVSGGVARDGDRVAIDHGRHLLNPGSVGQPRDDDARAAWLVLDTTAGHATFHRTAYPVAATQAEIRERGLPESLASRLSGS
ncbi:MAG: metallophosphoesterase family protein [Actinomycetes bacterium]